MKLYQTEVMIYASLYIRANSVEEANAKADALTDDQSIIEFSGRSQQIGDDLFMTGETFSADMPEMSLSPAMTIQSSPTKASCYLTEEFDNEPSECGQCEGTGTTQSASNLETEECPVCDGNGEIG
jgi:DnaJ-class molecular chaperone